MACALPRHQGPAFPGLRRLHWPARGSTAPNSGRLPRSGRYHAAMEGSALAQRVAQLERANRRLTLLALLPTLLLALGLLTSMLKQDPLPHKLEVDELVAKKVTAQEVMCQSSVDGTKYVTVLNAIGLVSATGNKRENWCSITSNGLLADTPTHYGLFLRATADSAEVSVLGPSAPGAVPSDGKPLPRDQSFPEGRLVLRTEGAKGSSLMLRDRFNRLRLALGAQAINQNGDKTGVADPEGTLTLWDESGKLLERLPR